MTNEPPSYPGPTPPPGQEPPSWGGGGGAYPPPAYGAPGGYGPQTLQKATWAMVLGILGLVCCGLASIAALIMGSQAKKEIAASRGALAGEGQAQAGFIMGIIGVALWVVGLLFYAVVFAAAIGSSGY